MSGRLQLRKLDIQFFNVPGIIVFSTNNQITDCNFLVLLKTLGQLIYLPPDTEFKSQLTFLKVL